MAAWLDGCRFTPTLGGTTDWTYSSAVLGYQSPTLAGVVNGTLYKYRAESADLTQWELGEGAYNTSTGVLARTTVLFNSSGTGTRPGQSGAGSKIAFGTVPQIAIVALAEDLTNLNAPNAFTDTTAATSPSTGALKTLGGIGVALAGWFGGLVSAAGGFVFSTPPGTAVALDASGQTVIPIANGASVGISPVSASGCGLAIIDERTMGFCAAYLLNDGGVTTVALSGNWVASTTTPASGKMSLAFNGTTNQYSVYNNIGSSISIKALVLRVS